MIEVDSYIDRHGDLRSTFFARQQGMSDLLVQLVRTHFANATIESDSAKIYLVGSVGRREFLLGKSDLDLVFLNMSDNEVDKVMLSIARNALPLLKLDPLGGSEIFSGESIKADLRKHYQPIQESDLFGDEREQAKRRIQLLFEASRVDTKEDDLSVQENIIRHYDLVSDSRRGVRLLIDDITKLEIDIQSTAATYFAWKAKKYIGLRIPQELGRRLSVIAAIYHKRARQNVDNPERAFVHLLRRRTVNALLFWEDYFLTGSRFVEYKKFTQIGKREISSHEEDLIRRLVHGSVSALVRIVDQYSKMDLSEIPDSLTSTRLSEFTDSLKLLLGKVKSLIDHLDELFQYLEKEGVFSYQESALRFALESTNSYINLRLSQSARWFSTEPFE